MSPERSERSRNVSLELIDKALAALTPSDYMRSIGYEPYEWQMEALDTPGQRDRLMICAARQSGKSLVIAARTQHTAKHFKNALNLIVCPAKDQSAELMQKVTVNISADEELYGMLIRDGVTLKEFSNMSRLAALPGTERSVRGYSNPRVIVLDEAARVLDETYMAIRPMMSREDSRADLIAMSTSFGKRGWFYRAWSNRESAWRKILVRVPWDIDGERLIPAMPEDEFRDYWKQRGVSAYYSTAHSKAQLEEDLAGGEIDPLTFRQEYICEFLDEGGGLFRYDDIMAAFASDQAEILRALASEEESAYADEEYIAPLEGR
jgi:hypothetical protein